MKRQEHISVQVKVPKDLHKEAKLALVRSGQTFQDFITQAIMKLVKK